MKDLNQESIKYAKSSARIFLKDFVAVAKALHQDDSIPAMEKVLEQYGFQILHTKPLHEVLRWSTHSVPFRKVVAPWTVFGEVHAFLGSAIMGCGSYISRVTVTYCELGIANMKGDIDFSLTKGGNIKTKNIVITEV